MFEKQANGEAKELFTIKVKASPEVVIEKLQQAGVSRFLYEMYPKRKEGFFELTVFLRQEFFSQLLNFGDSEETIKHNLSRAMFMVFFANNISYL